jgi:acyl carrier protein
MNTKDFINELIDALELEEGDIVDENSMLKEHYSSLGVLSIIALCDEQFSKELSSDELLSITTVKSLIDLIGMEHFEK